VADKDPDDVPSIPIPPMVDLTGNGGDTGEKKATPRKKPETKPETKAVPPAVPPATVAPVEAAPETPPAAEAQPNPYATPSAQPNPYAAAPAQPNPYATPGSTPGSTPGAPPSPYGAPQPYVNGPYVPQPPKGLSITSMVLGIASVLLSFCYGFGFLPAVAAVITGHMATKRQPYAKVYWLTGIITGYASIGIALLWVLILVVIVFASAPGGFSRF
jgi:hypothetical protein